MNLLRGPAGIWAGGIGLSLVLAVLVDLGSGSGGGLTPHWPVLVRWVHIVAGILWVGLLYYFNFVQMPAVQQALADSGGPGPAAIAKYLVPRALLWFRWAAVVTWLAGALYLAIDGTLLNVFSLGLLGGGDADYGFRLGVGVWLGTVLLINVWLVIWPNQKKILGIGGAVSAAESERAKQVVTKTAWINAVLSFPMLLFMAAGPHGAAF
jgi:uncharacterized membrane protein